MIAGRIPTGAPGLLAFILLSALPACTPSSAVATIGATGSSPGASISGGLATVPVGIVLGFQASAQSTTAVTATIDDPTIAVLAPATGDGQFVLIGTAVGQTVVHVFVNDTDATDLQVQVNPMAP
jgi:hypothetical protein